MSICWKPWTSTAAAPRDAENESGFEVPTGRYFYRFTAGRYVKTRKKIRVK